jgi:predicted phage-related endonuclease
MTLAAPHANRRGFIGGSDARIIMGTDETALVRLWREKRGEAEPQDYTDNLIVQAGGSHGVDGIVESIHATATHARLNRCPDEVREGSLTSSFQTPHVAFG